MCSGSRKTKAASSGPGRTGSVTLCCGGRGGRHGPHWDLGGRRSLSRQAGSGSWGVPMPGPGSRSGAARVYSATGSAAVDETGCSRGGEVRKREERCVEGPKTGWGLVLDSLPRCSSVLWLVDCRLRSTQGELGRPFFPSAPRMGVWVEACC